MPSRDIHELATSILEKDARYVVVFHWPVSGKALPTFDEIQANKVLELGELFDTLDEACHAAAHVMDIALHGLKPVGYAAEERL